MAETSALPATVFLDRDGTVVEEVDYLTRPEQLRLIPGAATAIRQLNERAIPVVLVTNQSAIARGLLSESALAVVHDKLRALLAAEGAHLDAIYYCPHHPDGIAPYRRDCDCRKPAPGMLRHAAQDLGLDLASSVMIGDNVRDLEAGAAAGCRTLILVRTGHGAEAVLPSSMQAQDYPDLPSALRELLAEGRFPASR